MNVAIPTAPSTSVTSSYQQFKRKLHSGKSETYDLTKVIDIYTKIHISLLKTPELINDEICLFFSSAIAFSLSE
jgi:hypothetical protein